MPNPNYLSEHWYTQFRALVDRNRKSYESDFVGCKALAPKLSKAAGVRPDWTPSYLLHVLNPTKSSKVGPSPRFKMAVEKLFSAPPRTRHDKLRVYVPVESIEERELINRVLSAPEKRNALLVAAHFEEGDE